MQNEMKELLQLLSTENYQTAADIAQKVGISSKTVRAKLKKLKEIEEKYSVIIISKPHYGYILEEKTESALEALETFLNQTESIPDSDEGRTYYILAALLESDGYVKVEELCESLYISRFTFQRSMKEAERILIQYGILIERRPHYGMMVKGAEFDIRRCIADCLVRGKFAGILSYPAEDMDTLRRKIMILTEKHQIRLSENALGNLVTQIYVALRRMKSGRYIEFETPDGTSGYQTELRLTEELVKWLTEWSGVCYDEHEIRYIAIYLAGIRMINGSANSADNFVISSEFDRMVAQMLELIYEEYRIDLRNNFNLRMALNQHMVPFDFRIRYKMYLKNPILDEIKEEYAFAYMLAQRVSDILGKHYGCDISEDEIGYFAILLAYGMEKNEKTIQKARILIVCVAGRGSSRILQNRYEREFGKYLDKIYICGEQELPYFDFGQVDYVFSTVPIRQKIPLPIVQIGYFLDGGDQVRVKNILERGRLDFLGIYYKKENFLTDVQGETNEEVIRNICDIIQKREHLTESFVEAVLERERLAQTDFGNRVAIPHPYKVVTNHTFVYVVVLKKEILWTRFPVQLVILSAISDADNDNLQKFYDVTSKLMGQKEMIDEIIRRKEFSLLSEYLNQLYYDM